MATIITVLIFLYLFKTHLAFYTYAPQNRQAQYQNTPVPFGYQPPPNPPIIDEYEHLNNQWRNGQSNQRQWNTQQSQWNNNQQQSGNQNAFQSNHPQGDRSQPIQKPEPVIIKTLIQVFANEHDPNSLYSEARLVTEVNGEDRIQISRDLETKKGVLISSDGRKLNSNPGNFAHVKAYAATNGSHITDKDLERELDRELETAIPLILDELDRIAKNNNVTATPPPDDINAKDLEKLIGDALTTITDPEERKQVELDLEKIKSLTSTHSPTTVTQVKEETTTTTATTTTAEPSTSPPLIIFRKTTVIPEAEESEDSTTESVSDMTRRLPPGVSVHVEDLQPASSSSTEESIPTSEKSTTDNLTEGPLPVSEDRQLLQEDTTQVLPEVDEEGKNPTEETTLTSKVTTMGQELIVPEHSANGDETREHPRTWKPRPPTTVTGIPTQAPSIVITSSPAITTPIPIETTPEDVIATIPETNDECPIPNDNTDGLKGDVLFLLDGSKTGSGQFGNGLRLIADTVRQFKSIGQDGIQISLIQYNEEPFLEFSFRKHNCITELLENIQQTKYMNGTSDLGRAVEKIMKYAFTKARGDRPDSPNVLVLISDEPDQNKAKIPVELAHQDDTTMLVVATVEADPEGLQEIADSSDLGSLDLKDVLKAPLAKRLAKKIEAVIKGEHHTVDDDLEIFSTASPSRPVPTVGQNVDKAEATTETPHHLPTTYSSENVQVECRSDGVTATFKLPEYFSGFIGAKGYETETGCYIEIPQTHEGSSLLRQVTFSVKAGECGHASISSATPRGRNNSVVINIFHHKELITDQDQSYIVQCFIPRRHVEHTLETHLDVEGLMAVSKTIALDAAPPQCEYTLRRDSPNGPILQSASIGQIIYHRWECKASEDVSSTYGLYVHDCKAFNGTDRSYEIIDKQGCAADSSLLGEVEYANDQILAHVRAHVFTFVNVESLLFSCKVSLCLRDGDGCEGYSPPVCHRTNTSEIILTRRTRQLEPSLEVSLTRQVHTANVGIMDMRRPQRTYHLSLNTYFVIFLIVVTVVLVIAAILWCMNERKTMQPSSQIRIYPLFESSKR